MSFSFICSVNTKPCKRKSINDYSFFQVSLILFPFLFREAKFPFSFLRIWSLRGISTKADVLILLDDLCFFFFKSRYRCKLTHASWKIVAFMNNTRSIMSLKFHIRWSTISNYFKLYLLDEQYEGWWKEEWLRERCKWQSTKSQHHLKLEPSRHQIQPYKRQQNRSRKHH